MSTTIKIKNSNVAGKTPDAGALESAELAINLKDRKLYSKDVDGNVFQIGGEGAQVPGGETPPPSGNEIGDLFFDTINNTLLYWDGSQWVPIAGDEAISLDDLEDVSVDGAKDGQVLIYDANSGEWIPGDIGLNTSPTPPTDPSPGDIWVDLSDCPPTLNIWDDCDDPGNPSWKPIGGGGSGTCTQGPVSIVSSNGTELGSTLTAVGGNGIDDSTPLTATYEWTGAKTGSGSTIVADVEGDYTVTATIECIDGSELGSAAIWTVSDSYVDMVNNTAPVIAVVGEGFDGAYEGNSIYVITNATVLNGISPTIVENQWFKDGTADGTGTLYAIGNGDVGKKITCKQLFRDARTNELLSEASNEITILDRPADAITFTPVITDDGSPDANTPNKNLTAAATNIVGGTAPVEYSFQWYADGAPEAAPGGQLKVKEILYTDVGKVITCDITVAEPDGSNPETRTATYGKVIVGGVEIKKPVVLTPPDGAGIGGDISYYPETSAIKTDGVETIPGGTYAQIPQNGWWSVVYGGGKFTAVAISGSSRVIHSADGENWTLASSANDSNDWKAIEYGNGKFVAVASDGSKRVMYASGPDGPWTGVTSSDESQNWVGVAYGNNKWVACANTSGGGAQRMHVCI